ncbi:hypothetical protein KC329_g8182 [Hortaea werneckii]|nr:hypothetical protein KC329_g8182 [Hortaea werneckii]
MATGFPQPAQQATRRSRMVLHDPAPANGLPTTTTTEPPPKPKCLPPYSGVDQSLLTHYAEYPEAEFALLSRTQRSQAFALQTDLLDQTTRKHDREALDVAPAGHREQSDFSGQPMGQGTDANGGINMTGFGASNEIPACNGGMFNLPSGQPVGQGMNEGRGIVRHGYPTPEDDMHDQLSGQPVGPGMNVPVGSHMNGAPMYNGGTFDQSNGQPVAQGMGMPFGNGVGGYPMPNANTPGQMNGQPVAPGMATFPGMQYPTANGGMVVQPGRQPVVSGMRVSARSHNPMANGGMVMLQEQQPLGLDMPVLAGSQYSTGDGNMGAQPDQQLFDQGMVASAGNDMLDPNGTSTAGLPDPVDGQPVGPNADFLLYDNTQVEEQLPSEMMAGQPDNATGSDDVMFGLTNYSAYERSQVFESVAMESELQDSGEEKAESDNVDGLDVDQLIDQRAVLHRWGAHLGGMV